MQESIYLQKASMKKNYTGYHQTNSLSETNLVASHCKFPFPTQVWWAYVDTLQICFQFSYYLEERHKWSLRKWTRLSTACLFKLKNLPLRSCRRQFSVVDYISARDAVSSRFQFNSIQTKKHKTVWCPVVLLYKD